MHWVVWGDGHIAENSNPSFKFDYDRSQTNSVGDRKGSRPWRGGVDRRENPTTFCTFNRTVRDRSNHNPPEGNHVDSLTSHFDVEHVRKSKFKKIQNDRGDACGKKNELH